jgi:hypothetical protein
MAACTGKPELNANAIVFRTTEKLAYSVIRHHAVEKWGTDDAKIVQQINDQIDAVIRMKAAINSSHIATRCSW